MRPVDTDRIETEIEHVEERLRNRETLQTRREEVPFMLWTSIEAIDADCIARLVEYIAEHTDYLVVALLEEDAAALDDRHERITSI